MIILLRKWDGIFPSLEDSKSTVWLGSSSSNLTAWVLSCSQLSWGYRETKGYLGSWLLHTDTSTYQWYCWTSERFARMAYAQNKKCVDKEKTMCYALTKELGLNIIDIPSTITINKDPAGLTATELNDVIVKKFQKETVDG